MKFAVSIGAYELLPFVELNIRSVREIFGDCPVLVYCGMGPNTPKIKELADRFECSFITERINRTHWKGCLMNACCSLAFSRANNCEISIKLNQRMILLSSQIPELIEEIFDDPKIDLALPPAIRAETIFDDASKFHARFPKMVDCIAMRASAVDPQWIADKYAEQVSTGTGRSDSLTEAFWNRLTENEFKDRWKPMPFLSEPNNPPLYLRKAQARQEDYQREAVRLGMEASDFPCQEWSQILGTAYRPMQAFA